MEFTNSVLIHRDPADVFEFLAHLENIPRWNYAIAQTRKTSTGPVRAGTTYVQFRTVPAPAEERLEVTEYVPDRRLSITGELAGMPAELSYVIEPAGDATLVTNTVRLQPSGLLRLAAPMATSRIKQAVAANLNVLQHILDRSPSPDPRRRARGSEPMIVSAGRVNSGSDNRQ